MRGDKVVLALASLAGPVAGQALDTVLTEGRDTLQTARFGRRQAKDRRLATVKSHANVNETETTVTLEKRLGARCGIDFGTSCEAGMCCSSAGWCGQGYLYCSAPSCQIEYGPACDANIRPSGPETKNVPRPKVGSVPYGTSVRRCTRPGDIALTYDDGPYIYTDDLLDKLKAYNAKATFYVTGNNLGKGKINDPNTAWPGLLRVRPLLVSFDCQADGSQRMIAEGHQIASHTWSHQRLTTLTESKFRNQMNYLEIALADLFGYFPTYMRYDHCRFCGLYNA
ncbi:chitin binding protein [Verticillium dahliae]|nr:chitin binding protein [Verticillium dahliae]